MKIVYCVKLQVEAPALRAPPFPGKLGSRIFEQISQPAWDSWIQEQTKIINELRLDVADSKSHELLRLKMLEYLFSEKPVDES